jgi:hypothetical protein
MRRRSVADSKRRRQPVRVPGRDPVREVDPLARFYLDDDPRVQQLTTPGSAEQRVLVARLRDALAGKASG